MTPCGRRRALLAMLCAAVAGGALDASADPEPGRDAVRVCSDPGNLPFSDRAGAGFENRIADLVGRAKGLPVTYYFAPQRINFVRNTLRYKLPGDDYPCDVIVGMPVGIGLPVALTKPYFRSTHVLVYAKGRGLDDVRSGADLLERAAQKRTLRIGVYDRSPAATWLANHGLVDVAVPHRMLNADPDWSAVRIVDESLVRGDLDAVIVWGPIGAWGAARSRDVALEVVPLRSEPGVRFDFEVAMAVRPGDTAWRDELDVLLEREAPAIARILDEYGVPRVDANGEPVR